MLNCTKQLLRGLMNIPCRGVMKPNHSLRSRLVQNRIRFVLRLRENPHKSNVVPFPGKLVSGSQKVGLLSWLEREPELEGHS